MKTITKTNQRTTTVRCANYHSGNHGLTRAGAGYWQCNGCGTFFTDAQVRDAQPGDIGQGGVISK